MITKSKRLLTLATVAVLSACSGSGAGPGGGGPTGGQGPETAALYCDELYATFAQRYADCWKAPLAWATEFIDAAKLCAGMTYAVGNANATYDRAAAGRCLAFFETASCADLRGYRDDVVYVADCRAAIVGKTVSDYFSTCSTDHECKSGLCSGGGATCPGSCYQGYTQGMACVADRDCAPGLYCYRGSLWPDATCQPFSNRPGGGQACSASTGCKPGLYCTGYFGTCSAQVVSGACTAGTGAMAPGYGCFSATAQPLLGPGQTCVPLADTCGPGLYCGAGSVCTQEPSVGQPCVYANGAYQGCIGGACDAMYHSPAQCISTATSSCYSNLDCRSNGYCDGGCQDFCI